MVAKQDNTVAGSVGAIVGRSGMSNLVIYYEAKRHSAKTAEIKNSLYLQYDTATPEKDCMGFGHLCTLDALILLINRTKIMVPEV